MDENEKYLMWCTHDVDHEGYTKLLSKTLNPKPPSRFSSRQSSLVHATDSRAPSFDETTSVLDQSKMNFKFAERQSEQKRDGDLG